MAGKSTEIVGEFVRIKHAFGEDDDRVIIAEIRIKDGTLSFPAVVKGPDPHDDLMLGLSYKFVGSWSEYRGNKQFWFKQFTQLEPLTRSSVVAYLCRYCHGIGTSLANKLFETYGQDTCQVLRDDPGKVANGVSGLTIEVAKLAQHALLANQRMEETRIQLTELMAGRGFSKSIIETLLKHRRFGLDAAKIIRRNPFSLLVNKVKSAGFARVDRLYLDLRHSPHKLKRQLFCLLDAIKNDGSGHTWFRASVLGEMIKKKVGGTNARPMLAMKLGIKAGYLAKRKDENGVVWIAESLAVDNEAVIAERVDELNSLPAPQWPDLSSLVSLTGHQRETLALALSSHVGLLPGTPGTGKTFTAAAVMQALCREVGGHRIACAAPTGKAAVRLTQALQGYGLPLKATTIHSLLFQADEFGILPYDYYVIDESSMIDTDLAAELLRLIPVGSHVLFIGDPYQLPPVGHGAVLRDMLSAGLPQGELTEVKRNAGRIVQACKEIRTDGTFSPSARFDPSTGENLCHIECPTSEAGVARLTQLLNKTPQSVNPVWDCQVICAVNEKTVASRKELNKYLQGYLNPGGEVIGETGFRLNDKVICKLNSSFQLVIGKCEMCGHSTCEAHCQECGAKQTEYSERVAKGEIGRITQASKKHLIITMESPVRSVRIPFRANSDGETGSLGLWDLAYAVTGHSSQGSQWKYVFIMADDSYGADRVSSREWWYTTISRAELGCFTIGKKTAIDRQCKRISLKDRKTFLVERIQETKKPTEVQA